MGIGSGVSVLKVGAREIYGYKLVRFPNPLYEVTVRSVGDPKGYKLVQQNILIVFAMIDIFSSNILAGYV